MEEHWKRLLIEKDCGRLHSEKEKHIVDGMTSAKRFTVLLCFEPFSISVLENVPHVDGTVKNCMYLARSAHLW
jgi:hypothetical protein